MGRFPSGQREQTVNLPSTTSMVRIHPCPPEKDDCESNRLFSFIRLAASCIALQFYCALHSVIRFASLLANIISLKPQVSISLSRSENITVPQAQYN